MVQRTISPKAASGRLFQALRYSLRLAVIVHRRSNYPWAIGVVRQMSER